MSLILALLISAASAIGFGYMAMRYVRNNLHQTLSRETDIKSGSLAEAFRELAECILFVALVCPLSFFLGMGVMAILTIIFK